MIDQLKDLAYHCKQKIDYHNEQANKWEDFRPAASQRERASALAYKDCHDRLVAIIEANR